MEQTPQEIYRRIKKEEADRSLGKVFLKLANLVPIVGEMLFQRSP